MDLRRLAACLLASFALAGAGCSSRPPDDTAETGGVVIQAPALALVTVKKLLRQKKHAEADRLLDGILSHPDFGAMHPVTQKDALYTAGWVARTLRNDAKAHPLLVRSTASEHADQYDWYLRASTALAIGNVPDAVASLTVEARRWPNSVRTINPQVVYQILDESRKPEADPAASFELHRALFEAKWRPRNDFEPNPTWKALALLWIERGQVDKAEEVLTRITSPITLVGMRADKRFDALRERNPQRFDVRAALERDVAANRKRVEDNPGSLYLFAQLTYALLSAKRFEEVLSLTEPFMGDKAPTDAFVLRYADWAAQILWVHNNRAIALRGLGRYDEAVALLRATTRKAEGGDINVSQSINLGLLLNRMGRPQEALEAVGQIGEMSPYGRLLYESIRFHAALQLNDQPRVEETLAYLREHRYDSLATYQYALIKLGRLDEAAKVLIERLGDLRYRSDALGELQDTYSLPAPPRVSSPGSGDWAKLLERKDVKAAIDKVGRIESYDFLFDV